MAHLALGEIREVFRRQRLQREARAPGLDRDAPRIRSLVERGYLVRTRADSPVATAVSGDTAQQTAAFAGGAQWVSTDYPVPGAASRVGSDYVVALPRGAVARCNPVAAPTGCNRSRLGETPPPPPVPLDPPWLPRPPARTRSG